MREKGAAIRQAGRFDKAIEYYNLVLTDANFRNQDYEQRFKARARESIEAIKLYEKADVRSLADGSYHGSSTGYNGSLDVEVKVASGQMESVEVRPTSREAVVLGAHRHRERDSQVADGARS